MQEHMQEPRLSTSLSRGDASWNSFDGRTRHTSRCRRIEACRIPLLPNSCSSLMQPPSCAARARRTDEQFAVPCRSSCSHECVALQPAIRVRPRLRETKPEGPSSTCPQDDQPAVCSCQASARLSPPEHPVDRRLESLESVGFAHRHCDRRSSCRLGHASELAAA